jgi:hypothetical protein
VLIDNRIDLVLVLLLDGTYSSLSFFFLSSQLPHFFLKLLLSHSESLEVSEHALVVLSELRNLMVLLQLGLLILLLLLSKFLILLVADLVHNTHARFLLLNYLVLFLKFVFELLNSVL